jgi:hypothetical protein
MPNEELGPAPLARCPARGAVVVADSVSMRPFDFYRDALALLGGPNHGLKVGLIGDDELLEILGALPAGWRKRLRRVATGPIATRGRVSWRDARITWCERLDGRGPRFAVPGLGALLDIVAERRLELEGRAC